MNFNVGENEDEACRLREERRLKVLEILKKLDDTQIHEGVKDELN